MAELLIVVGWALSFTMSTTAASIQDRDAASVITELEERLAEAWSFIFATAGGMSWRHEARRSRREYAPSAWGRSLSARKQVDLTCGGQARPGAPDAAPGGTRAARGRFAGKRYFTSSPPRL